jgi:hypothetical protein
MQSHDFEQNYHGLVRVEYCLPCAGIWFDHLSSIQLAPGAVIELFKQIHSRAEAPRQPLADHLSCPRCGDLLEQGFDLCKSGRFSYFRCLRGDGRFTPFVQFLREKQFVRSLTAPELAKVRAQVRQINCSECGAPIDLENATACPFCHSPIAFLDPDAVEKAVKMWADADNRRHQSVTPQTVGDALAKIHFTHAAPAASPASHLSELMLAGITAGVGIDLVSLGIGAIGRLFEDT